MGHKHTAEKEKTRIVAMRDKGLSLSRIADKTGRSVRTVRKVLNAAAGVEANEPIPPSVPYAEEVASTRMLSKEHLALSVVNSGLPDDEKVAVARYILQ